MIGTTKLHYYLATLKQQKIAPEAVLSGTGICLAHLDNPNYLVDIQQYQLIIANMIGLTGNYALGLSMMDTITFSDMGVFGYAIMSAPTIKESIALWRNYSRPLFGFELELELEEDQPAWHLIVNQPLPSGPVYQFFMEEFLMLMRSIGRLVSGQEVVFSQIELSYPEPAHANQYREIFACPIIFNSHQNRVSVSAPKINAPLKSRDPQLNAMYRKFCDRMSGGIAYERPVSARIINYLLSMANRMPSIQQTARYMNCSERSLRRHLDQEGVTFRQLVNQFRRDMAIEYLQTTSFSAQQIAEILGYQDSKPFLRAFKLWTGMTIGEFKKYHGATDS